MQYRREIDGLRALAVLPVILFHAGLESFSGGFVGVDVFFVISGYLITSIILSEKMAGSFSLINFYERRARRILPALFLVMAACFPFAWFWLLPTDMKDFSESVAAVSVFSSNFLFWQESGYFDTAAELKPLQHTWSLAVEEQFYVFFPLLLMAAWGLGKRILIVLLLLVAASSLAFAHWGAFNQPTATFFLLPTRAWELLIGAFVAFYFLRNTESKSSQLAPYPFVNELAALTGLLLILYAVFAFSKDTPFPSLYALAPTIGAALIILFARPSTLVGKLLGNKLFVGIGLISYSAYLWHQPLFAFARISLEEAGLNVLLPLSLVSLLLAYLTWRFVERPFRNKQWINRKKIFLFSLVLSVLFIAVGLYGHLSGGFSKRYSEQANLLLESTNLDYVKKEMIAFGRGQCFIDNDQTYKDLLLNGCLPDETPSKRIFVFGDSHAAHLISGIRNRFEDTDIGITQWTAAACRAIDISEKSRRCKEFYTYFVKEIVPGLRESDIVVISSNWHGVYRKLGEEKVMRALDELFQILTTSKAKIYVFGSTPHFKKLPQTYMVKEKLYESDRVLMETHQIDHINNFLQEETNRYGFEFFNPSEVFCLDADTQSCLAQINGKLLFLDTGHLSVAGSVLVTDEWIKSRDIWE